MQTRIGKYLLKKKLGASGSVYLAVDEFSGWEVALKFYEAGNGHRSVSVLFQRHAMPRG